MTVSQDAQQDEAKTRVLIAEVNDDNRYLAKPVEPSRLVRAVGTLLSSGSCWPTA